MGGMYSITEQIGFLELLPINAEDIEAFSGSAISRYDES